MDSTTITRTAEDEFGDALAQSVTGEERYDRRAAGDAPDGPHETAINLHPRTRGYRGIGKRFWWTAGAVCAVIVFAFLLGSGALRGGARNPDQSLSAQALPAPEPTALFDTSRQSNAVPINGTLAPLRSSHPVARSSTPPTGAPAPQDTGYGAQLRAGAQYTPAVRVPEVQPYAPPQYPQTQTDPRVLAQAQAAQQALAQQQQAAGSALVISATTHDANAAATNSPTPAPSAIAIYNDPSGQSASQDTAATYGIWPGDVIAAVLDTGIISDIPGPVLAHVTADVYDTRSGSRLLIPRGSRIVGAYASATSPAQNRMGIDWQILVLPDGREVDLSGLQAADLAGNPGLPASVNLHQGRMLRTTLILGGLAGLSQLANPQQAIGVNGQPQSVLGTIASAQAQQFVNSGSQMIQRDQSVAPTLTIPKNTAFTIVVSKKLSLPAYSPAQQQE